MMISVGRNLRFSMLLGLAAASVSALAQDVPRSAGPNIRVEQKLNAQVPLDLPFKDMDGKDVTLRQFFGKKPVALILVFYKCGGTCTQELEEAVRSFNAIKPLEISKDYEVVTVSIHPEEGPELARLKHEIYAQEKYTRPGGEKGWHFLVGPESSSRALSDAVGFYYEYDKEKNTVRHPNALIILTPEGKVSQYLMGLIYPQKLVLESLKDAGNNEIGIRDETPFWVCFQWDPSVGKYTPIVNNILMIGGLLFLVAFATSIFLMSRKPRTFPDIPLEEDRPTDS